MEPPTWHHPWSPKAIRSSRLGRWSRALQPRMFGCLSLSLSLALCAYHMYVEICIYIYIYMYVHKLKWQFWRWLNAWHVFEIVLMSHLVIYLSRNQLISTVSFNPNMQWHVGITDTFTAIASESHIFWRSSNTWILNIFRIDFPTDLPMETISLEHLSRLSIHFFMNSEVGCSWQPLR